MFVRNSLNNIYMKKFINQSIKDNEAKALDFETFDGSGHVQFNRGNWAIFFNAKCVHVSKTLNSLVNKLNKLNVKITDFKTL